MLTPLLSETSEITTVRAAIRTIAGYQLQMSRLTYPYRPTAARAVKAPASPTGFGVQLEIWIRHVIAALQIRLWR